MDISLVTALSLGFFLGLRHALDPDHLVAVSTIVSEHKSIARSSIVGTFWGLGHTASLMAIGLVVILQKSLIPERIALWMEMCVAAMLMALGASVLWRVFSERRLRLHAHVHSHDGGPPHTHIHFHTHEAHDHRHKMLRLGRKPFVVGLVHGAAGSAALTLAVLTQIPSVMLGLAYIMMFGLGSVGGMLLMSMMISLPFALTARRVTALNSGVRVAAGLLSIAFGAMLAWSLLVEIMWLTS
jgi:ABC-type nickel/cobalt efflux system permease component RcnA